MTKLEQLKKKLAAKNKQYDKLQDKLNKAEDIAMKLENQCADLCNECNDLDDDIADLEAKEEGETPVRAAAKFIDANILTITKQLQGRGTPTVVDNKRADAVNIVLRWAVKELLNK